MDELEFDSDFTVELIADGEGSELVAEPRGRFESEGEGMLFDVRAAALWSGEEVLCSDAVVDSGETWLST